MELLSLKNVSSESKIALLKELGYDSDGIFVLDTNGNKYYDKYINEPIRIDSMLILPSFLGSTIVLDNNLVSIVYYFEDYLDIIF